MRTRSVLTRMLIWAWCILAAALLALFLVSAQEAQEEVVREATHRAERELDTVKWLLVNHGPFAARQDFDAWIKELGKRLEIRVTFVAEGKVLADSMVPLDRLDSLQDHSTRPEIQHADVNAISTSRRHSETLDREMLYAATQLPPVSGLPRGVLRLAVPFSDLQERLSSMLTRALWTMGLALAVSGILLLMGIRNVGRSIGAFTDMAREMGNGDFSHRIREIPGREFKPLAEAVNAMARRIERHVGTIEEQGGRLRAMFQGMSEGVLVLDERGRIESFNRALEAMHPQVAEAMDRTPLEAGLPLEVQDACDRRRHRSDPGSAPVPSADRGEQVRVCVDESQHLDVSVVPFTGHNGDRKLILVFRDVTAEVAHERALRDFVANASHQLRTPLTSIKGYAETLLGRPAREPRGRHQIPAHHPAQRRSYGRRADQHAQAGPFRASCPERGRTRRGGCPASTRQRAHGPDTACGRGWRAHRRGSA